MTETRISINFMAIWGRAVIKNHPSIGVEDDEQALTLDIPSVIERCTSIEPSVGRWLLLRGSAILVETTSIVAHFAFGPQKPITSTDILERFRNLPVENVCPKGIFEPEFSSNGGSLPDYVLKQTEEEQEQGRSTT